MEIKEVIEVLQHCGKPGSDCHNCKMYSYSASCLRKLCNEAAAALESQQKRIAELEEKNRWIPGKKPPKTWKDKNGDAINFLAIIPGVGVDIANWIEPTRCWFCMGLPCKVTHWKPMPEPPKEDT